MCSRIASLCVLYASWGIGPTVILVVRARPWGMGESGGLIVRAADHTCGLRAVGAGRASCAQQTEGLSSGIGEALSPRARTHWFREGRFCTPGVYGQWAQCSVAMVGQGSTVQSTARCPYRGQRRTLGKLQARLCTARASRLPGARTPPIEKAPLSNFAAARQQLPSHRCTFRGQNTAPPGRRSSDRGG